MGLGSSSEKSVWSRSGADHSLSKNVFAGLVSFWTAAGIAVSAFFASLTTNWHPSIWLALPLMLIPFLGVFVALGSKNPLVSLFGYGLIVVPFGLFLGPTVAMYTAASVVKVFSLTMLITVSLGTIGAIYPKSLESWGIYLLGILLVLIFARFGLLIVGMFGVPVSGGMTVFDYVGVALFSAYIVYDMNRAMRVERTLDNSIDCAVALYLDILNLFLSLLRIMGKAKD